MNGSPSSTEQPAASPATARQRECWQENPLIVAQGATCLFLGREADSSRSESPPTSPTHRPGRKLSHGSISQDPVLVLGACPFQRHPHDLSAADLFYFEVFIRTTGGGLMPSGSIGVGLATAPPTIEQLAPSRYASGAWTASA